MRRLKAFARPVDVVVVVLVVGVVGALLYSLLFLLLLLLYVPHSYACEQGPALMRGN